MLTSREGPGYVRVGGQYRKSKHALPLVSYLGVDGMAEEWWSTISQRSPFLT